MTQITDVTMNASYVALDARYLDALTEVCTCDFDSLALKEHTEECERAAHIHALVSCACHYHMPIEDVEHVLHFYKYYEDKEEYKIVWDAIQYVDRLTTDMTELYLDLRKAIKNKSLIAIVKHCVDCLHTFRNSMNQLNTDCIEADSIITHVSGINDILSDFYWTFRDNLIDARLIIRLTTAILDLINAQ